MYTNVFSRSSWGLLVAVFPSFVYFLWTARCAVNARYANQNFCHHVPVVVGGFGVASTPILKLPRFISRVKMLCSVRRDHISGCCPALAEWQRNSQDADTWTLVTCKNPCQMCHTVTKKKFESTRSVRFDTCLRSIRYRVSSLWPPTQSPCVWRKPLYPSLPFAPEERAFSISHEQLPIAQRRMRPMGR